MNYLKKISISFLVMGIISLAIYKIIDHNNFYTEKKNTKCTIVDKFISKHEKCVFKLRDSNGNYLEINVNPSIYFNNNVNDVRIFQLSELDIKYSTKKYILYELFPLIMLSSALSFYLISLLVFLMSFDKRLQ